MIFCDVITIEKESNPDGENNPAYEFPFAEDIPCRVVDVRGYETYKGRQLTAGTDFMVELWHYPSITPDMRVLVKAGVHCGKTLNIVHVQDVQKDAAQLTTSLFCKEKTL